MRSLLYDFPNRTNIRDYSLWVSLLIVGHSRDEMFARRFATERGEEFSASFRLGGVKDQVTMLPSARFLE